MRDSALPGPPQMAWSKPTDERNACVRVESDRGEKSTKFFRRELPRGGSARTQDGSGGGASASRKPSRQVPTRIRMRVVRYRGALTLLLEGTSLRLNRHTQTQHRSLGRIVLRTIPHLGRQRDSLAFMSVTVSGRISTSRDGANTPFQANRILVT